MFVYVPHKPRKGYELKLEPGERELGSYMEGALAYSWLLAGTLVVVAAMVVGFVIASDGKASMAIASMLSANMLLFGALGKRRLYITNKRLVLMQKSKHEKSLDLADIRGIEVRGRKVGRVTVRSLSGAELSASLYNPLTVAAEIQAACAELNEERKLNWKEARNDRAG